MHEFKLLGYNLNFIPAPGYLNLNHFNQDIMPFGRKIKLRAHFGPNNKTNNREIMFHKGNITWKPSQVHHTISTFLESFSNSLNETLNRQKDKTVHNLSKEEAKASQSLMNRNDIIICNADKGGAVVIIDIDDYIKEAMRQLSDTKHYEEIPNDSTTLHCELVKNTINKFKNDGLLEDKLAEGLKVVNSTFSPTSEDTQKE